jgi:hypothetical protein
MWLQRYLSKPSATLISKPSRSGAIKLPPLQKSFQAIEPHENY